ncbi:hypothetical protein PsorP6_014818 [Peronosclerospora sorghi]|uniref:Uncharacterized protein n=1 Tax=Peronosclerospora sorghi TaxID=230839 RepID=A0ACC0VTL1_9STRA|nr:hypothetical protein PsorP6_014818 [Peronosclerospora sorghi]
MSTRVDPGAAIQIPGITAKDEEDLLPFAIPHGVDIVSGSFVRSEANVRAIRQCLGEAGRHFCSMTKKKLCNLTPSGSMSPTPRSMALMPSCCMVTRPKACTRKKEWPPWHGFVSKRGKHSTTRNSSPPSSSRELVRICGQLGRRNFARDERSTDHFYHGYWHEHKIAGQYRPKANILAVTSSTLSSRQRMGVSMW